MQAAEHWEGDDVPLGMALRGDQGLLVDPLVSCVFPEDQSAESGLT
jgi:hypothetical protein